MMKQLRVILAGSPQDVHNVSSTSGMDPKDPGPMPVPGPSREKAVSNTIPCQEQDIGNYYAGNNLVRQRQKAAQEKI